MHAIPFITDALKIGFPLALVGSIVGEFIAGNSGIGYLILSGAVRTRQTARVRRTAVDHAVHDGIGLITVFESRMLVWRP